jgi:hypothetical protein
MAVRKGWQLSHCPLFLFAAPPLPPGERGTLWVETPTDMVVFFFFFFFFFFFGGGGGHERISRAVATRATSHGTPQGGRSGGSMGTIGRAGQETHAGRRTLALALCTRVKVLGGLCDCFLGSLGPFCR